MRRTKPWRTLRVEHPVNLPFFRLRKEVVELPSGEVFDYFIQETTGWVGVFCVTVQDKVILNRQYKHGIGRYVLELPAGGIEKGETPLACAKRELLEETGYVAERFKRIRSFIIDPSSSEGMMHLFYCESARRVRPRKPDPTEQVKNRLVSRKDLVRLLRNGKIGVLGHVAAIYAVLDAKGLLEVNLDRGTGRL